MEPLDTGPVHKLGRCSHTFHLACIIRCRRNRHTRCPLCREEISPGLTPSSSHDRWSFSARGGAERDRSFFARFPRRAWRSGPFQAHRGYSPLDLGGDIRAAASRARNALRTRLAAIESAREEEEELPTLGGAPQRFTLTEDDDF